MTQPKRETDALLAAFFDRNDLGELTAEAGGLLNCPILVLDDAFHVAAHYWPLGFSDPVFQEAVRQQQVSYEVGASISHSPNLAAGGADYTRREGSPLLWRVAALISGGIRLGYLICGDTDGSLPGIREEIFDTVQRVLAKQLYIETSCQDQLFETAEDILIHLLDGGFSSEAYFRLQTAGTYLADLHPTGFALADLTAYRELHPGQRHLKDALDAWFPNSHSFLYHGDVLFFLYGRERTGDFAALAEEFRLKVAVSEGLNRLWSLPSHYRTAHEALELMLDEGFHGGRVCRVDRMRTALLLKNLESRSDLVARELRNLADHDRQKETQYCETLYTYLCCGRSLKKTCDVLFTHRNTVLYRIQRMQEDFCLPLDEPAAHADLLLGVSLLLFQRKGPDFFLPPEPEEG